MTQKRKDLPQPSASNFQQRLREALQTYMGRQGDPLDRGITLRDLLDTGLAKLRDGATLGLGSSTPPIAPIPVNIPVYEADLTPPPQPDGFAVSAAISHVFIEHNPPTYTQGHGHLRTRVYGAIVTPALPAPVFGDAVEIAQFSGTIHAHPSNPATTWRLWIKWESADGVLSATPAGGTNGLLATTGEDVSPLLDALAGSITSTELASSLATPIALINQPTTGIVARLDAQTTIIGTLQTEVAALSGTPDYEAGVTYDTDDIVQYDGGLYRALSATTGNLPTNATYWQKIGDYASLGDAVAAHAVQLGDHQTRIVATEAGLVAEAGARSVLASTVDANTAAIGNEASTRASADSALSSTISSVSAVANSKVKTYNQTSVPTSGMSVGDLWFDSDANNRVYRYSGSAWIETTDPRIASTAAAVTTETTARVAADTALASQITTLSGTVAGNTAAITAEATARAGADSAFATQVTTLQASVASAGGENLLYNPSFETESTTAGLAEGWAIYSASGAVWTRSLPTAWLAVNEKAQRIDFTGLSASGYVDLQTVTGQRVTVVEGGSLAASISFRATAGAIVRIFIQPINASNAVLQTVAGTTVTATGATQTLSCVMASAPAGTVRAIVLFRVGGVTGTIAAGFVEWDRAQVERGTTVSGWRDSSRVLTASLQVEALARANADGELYAQYTVKTDVAGLVSGYGLASTANNAAPTSSFGVRASNFFVAPPSVSSATAPTANLYKGFVWLDASVTPNVTRYWTGSAWVTTPQVFPFVIQAAPTTINGVTVPVGVYIEDAFIKNGTITNAKIGNAQIDDAKISDLSVDKLTAGSIAVGQHIQATGYVAGSAGWRINGNGTAEFSGVVVRGTIYANAGMIGGIIIASNAVRAGQLVFNSGQGFYLGADGRFSLGNSTGNRVTWDGTNLNVVSPGLTLLDGSATFSGNLSAVGGTFSGQLSGASGSFSGTLLAGTLDVSQLVGQLVTFASAGNYTRTVPAGFSRMRVTCVGGGAGGGAGGSSVQASGGGGGGGGGFSVATFTVTPGATISATVGGAGGIGAAGGASIVSGYLSANGGSPGGTGASSSAGVGGGGGGGGAGGFLNGNNGANGANTYTYEWYQDGGDSGQWYTNWAPGAGGAGGAPRYGGYGAGGRGGDGGTGSGRAGGTSGLVQLEFFNPNGVIIRSDWDTLQSALIRQNIQVV